MTVTMDRSFTNQKGDELRDWREGPWSDEPDKGQWVDEVTDLDCLIVRNHFGSLCGYVGVTEGHPWFGKGYEDVDADVHGGLTFAGSCMESAPENEGVCHVPLDGRDGNVWWLGFDCGHAWDYQPGLAKQMEEIGHPEWGRPLGSGGPLDVVYRPWGYVEQEVADLARQASAARGSSRFSNLEL